MSPMPLVRLPMLTLGETDIAARSRREVLDASILRRAPSALHCLNSCAWLNMPVLVETANAPASVSLRPVWFTMLS